MKDLFMCLLISLAAHGKLTEANMYKGGTYSNVTVETSHGVYEVAIMKKVEEKEND